MIRRYGSRGNASTERIVKKISDGAGAPKGLGKGRNRAQRKAAVAPRALPAPPRVVCCVKDGPALPSRAIEGDDRAPTPKKGGFHWQSLRESGS